jgi:large subunit ribosomal protein L25
MEYNCLIKEIQKDPATGRLLHVDLQSVEEDNLIKMRLPVVFKGRNLLEKKQFVLHVYIRELVVAGKVNSMPESIVVNLDEKKPGDKIMVKDIVLGKDVSFLGDKNEIIAAVTVSRELEAVS